MTASLISSFKYFRQLYFHIFQNSSKKPEIRFCRPFLSIRKLYQTFRSTEKEEQKLFPTCQAKDWKHAGRHFRTGSGDAEEWRWKKPKLAEVLAMQRHLCTHVQRKSGDRQPSQRTTCNLASKTRHVKCPLRRILGLGSRIIIFPGSNAEKHCAGADYQIAERSNKSCASRASGVMLSFWFLFHLDLQP